VEVIRSAWQDIRYATRILSRQRGLTFVAVITLALGVGANTAIFSVVNAVLLRPLPYREAERLVRIWETNEAEGGAKEMTSVSNLLDWQRHSRSFEAMAAWQRTSSVTCTGNGPATELTASFVTGSLFAVLGVDAARGRTFAPEEATPGHARVAVLSHALWQRELGGDPGIVGGRLHLEGVGVRVVGVMPRDFKSPGGDADVWLPMTVTPNSIDRGQTYLSAVGRLKRGVSLDQAQAEAGSIAAELERLFPASNRRRGLVLVPLLQETVGPSRPMLLMVFGAVVLVLLTACANVANLFLVSAGSREHEMALRTALGAGRLRLLRQLAVERGLVFAAGGLLGVLLAEWTIGLLQALSPGNIPRLDEVALDGTTVLFTAAVCVLLGAIFGLTPALYGAKRDLHAPLRERRPSSEGGRHRLRNAFVVAQLALALVLLVGAALLMESFRRLRSVPPGFDPENLLVVRMFLDDEYRQDRRQVAFFRKLVQGLESLPGVEAAAAATVLPLNPVGIDFDVPWYREGEPEPQRASAPKARFRSATPGYFRTLRIPLVRGRALSDDDQHDSPLVVVVNRALADRAWPGQDPVGKALRVFWADWRTYVVVGVAGNTKSYGLAAESEPELFVPHAQIPYTVMNLVIRATHEPSSVALAARKMILEMDPSQPPHSILEMDDLLRRSLARERFALVALEILSGLAVALSAIGLYGTLSWRVTERTHEVGIRLALGARPRDVLTMFIKQGMALTLFGVSAGLVCALLLARTAESLLFGVRANDPTALVGGALLFSGVALVASYVPARRAATVDAVEALRHE
jgi:putative ABC transport system permease protein